VLRNQGVGAPASAVIIYRCSDYTLAALEIEPHAYSLRKHFNRTVKTQRKYKTSVIGTPFKLLS